MKYRLGDICTIAKGETGIMKAVPGPYPMVTLAEERKQHDTYQFDAAAVIVPLISSTGHGHASMKRVHYQEGKFALGTILCAVIPKDEELLNARYLFVYLQQFKDSVLVPLMKGAANVSLPLNKLAALEIEVPTLAKQQEIIALAEVLTGHKNDLETLLDAQEADTVKLRQALLREAMQGQLLPQDPTDEPAAALLQRLRTAKAAAGKGGRGRAGTLFAAAEPVEGPFEIPASWVWCTLGDLIIASDAGTSFQCANRPIIGNEWGVIKLSAISWDKFLPEQNKFYSAEIPEDLAAQVRTGDFIISRANTTELVGKSVVVQEGNYNLLLSDKSIRFTFSPLVSVAYANLCNNSQYARAYYADAANGSSPSMKNITQANMRNLPIPLPPLAEQHRLVAKLGQLLAHCDTLEQRIRASRRLAEQLLATALREALAPPAPAEAAAAPTRRAGGAGAQLSLGALLG